MKRISNVGFSVSGHPSVFVMLIAILVCSATPAMAQNAAGGLKQQVAALKAEMAASQASLRQYEWIETTVISVNGEEKARTQTQCYYGADGVLEKVDVVAPPPPEHKHGIRGRIAEKKKAEMTDYMKSAVALMKTYVPPDPAKLQAVMDAGDVTIQPRDNGQRVRLDFSNYEKAGDSLAIEVDLSSHKPTGISVASYLDEPSDAVNLGVIMSSLEDGTVYPSTTTLDAQAKNLVVTTTNSGYRKKGS